MKITRLAAMAKEHKSVTLINTTDDQQIIRQHVMIGNAVYPMDGFPVLDGDELLAVLDVPLEKRKEYYVYIRTMDEWDGMQLLTADTHHTDREARLMECVICTPWSTVMAAYTQNGVAFLEAEGRKVIDKEKDVSWWSRTMKSGATALIAKKGMQQIAAFMPCGNWMSDSICEDLWHIAQAARSSMEKVKQAENNGDQLHV